MKADWREVELERLQREYSVLSMDELRQLPEAGEFDCGVYFLWLNDELQYIGKSKQILDRLYRQETVNKYWPHQQSKKVRHIPHDRHTCLVLESGRIHSRLIDYQLKDMERLYIATYPTPHNDPTFQAFT